MQLVGDLFVPVIDRVDFHPYFARLVTDASEAEREVIREWARGLVDRDGKFAKEFQSSFNSSFWELYLFACLKHLNVSIDCTNSRPDFLVDGQLGKVVLEAVVALNPDGLSPDWAKHELSDNANREDLLDLAALRLAQSVDEKSKKWLQSYSSLAHCADRSFVICVAPFEQPNSQLQGTQGIARVLFGEDKELILKDDSKNFLVGSAQLTETFKPSGAPVRLGLFRNGSMAHVAGVLFSSLATWSKVSALAADDGREFVFHTVVIRAGGTLESRTYRKSEYNESLLAGVHLFVNPFAARPIQTGPWRDAGIAVHQLTVPDLQPNSDLPDGALVVRRSFRFSTSSAATHPPGAPRAADFPQHTRAKPRDNEWYGGPATLGTSDQVYLSLHRGWTICVGHDPTDDDWQCMVKWGEFLSLQDFIDAGDPGPTKAMIAVAFATREKALENARTWVATKSLRKWRSSSKKRRPSG